MLFLFWDKSCLGWPSRPDPPISFLHAGITGACPHPVGPLPSWSVPPFLSSAPFNPRTQNAEARKSLNLRLACPTQSSRPARTAQWDSVCGLCMWAGRFGDFCGAKASDRLWRSWGGSEAQGAMNLKPHPSPLQEQHTLLLTEPALQPLFPFEIRPCNGVLSDPGPVAVLPLPLECCD